MPTWLVDYADGHRFRIPAPPLLAQVEGRTVVLPDLIQDYHDDLLAAIAGRTVWPFDELADLYAEFGPFYDPLGTLLGIQPARLTPLSRHRLFIASEPVTLRGQLARGLSGIETLLGFNYPEAQDASETSQDVLGGSDVVDPLAADRTGSNALDLLTGSLLVFKDPGLPLAHALGVVDMGKVLIYAGAQMAAAHADNDLPPPPSEKPETLPAIANEADIQSALTRSGVPLPQI